MAIAQENIIGVLYASGELQRVCSSVCRDVNLVDDLTSEIILILLEKDPSTIQELNESGALLAYVRGITKKQWCSTTSPFYRKYRKQSLKNVEIDDTKI